LLETQRIVNRLTGAGCALCRLSRSDGDGGRRFRRHCRILLTLAPVSKTCRAVLALAALAMPAAARSAPYVPASDAQVLETLPARAADPRMRAIAALRQRLAKDPRDAATAVDLAWRYYDEVAVEGDPRWVGYAQAALAPWWAVEAPPPGVRVIRAVLRQFGHDFEGARADLQAALRENPEDGAAWSWRAAIDMVQARYDDARQACRGLASEAPALVAVACTAAADSLTGGADAAAAALRAALAADRDASPAQRLWALTRLAEIDERRGDAAAAEASFRAALALDLADGYLLAAWSDFLLDRGRAAEVVATLKGRERSDLLLLRLAIAARALNAPEAPKWQAELAARFDAARLRGDATHQKEEARFALAVQGDAARALPLAVANWAVQKEPADARVLLEAAIAARDARAAAPVLAWMDRHGVQSVALRALAAKLKAAS
jgi:Tfp pilus assembly protein PilF